MPTTFRSDAGKSPWRIALEHQKMFVAMPLMTVWLAVLTHEPWSWLLVVAATAFVGWTTTSDANHLRDNWLVLDADGATLSIDETIVQLRTAEVLRLRWVAGTTTAVNTVADTPSDLTVVTASGRHTVELLFGRRQDRDTTRDAVRSHFPGATWEQFGGPWRAAWADWRTGWRGEEPW